MILGALIGWLAGFSLLLACILITGGQPKWSGLVIWPICMASWLIELAQHRWGRS